MNREQSQIGFSPKRPIILHTLPPARSAVKPLDYNSEMVVQVQSKISNLIFLRHFLRSTEVKIGFSPKRPIFLHACGTCSKLPLACSAVKPLDCNSEMGVQVQSKISNLIFLRHFLRSTEVKIGFSPKRPIFLHACGSCSELPPDISTMCTTLLSQSTIPGPESHYRVTS